MSKGGVTIAFSDKNLAEGKPTRQSSTNLAFHGTSARAVDGNASPNYWHQSCTRTNEEKQPFWTVDLGSEYGVAEVEITNRGDCCGNILKIIYISNSLLVQFMFVFQMKIPSDVNMT